jgi:hypothetical protein
MEHTEKEVVPICIISHPESIVEFNNTFIVVEQISVRKVDSVAEFRIRYFPNTGLQRNSQNLFGDRNLIIQHD